jgi:hypothetical protein
MDFGTIAVGDSTRDSIFITNNDSNIIIIPSIFSDNEHFWISHSSLALNPSETKTLYVSFSPDTVSSFSGKIIFEHDSSDSPDTVIVMANGVSSAISFSADSIDFENVVLNFDTLVTVSVANITSQTLFIDSIRTNHSAISVSPQQINLLSYSNGTIDVHFFTLTSGEKNGFVIFYFHSSTSPDSLFVTGNGVEPIFSVSPSSIDFGGVVIGTSDTASVYVKNIGTSLLSITNTGSELSQFVLQPSLAIIQPNDSAKFFVIFTPTAPNVFNGNVLFFHNAASGQEGMYVLGNGINPVPTLITLSSTSKDIGSNGFTLTVNGTNCISNSVIRINAIERTTTFVDSSKLTTQISAEELLVARIDSVTILNPEPGGGISNALPFEVKKNAVVVRVFRDADGNASTINDWKKRFWDISLYKEVDDTLNFLSSVTSDSTTFDSLAAGNYSVILSDNDGWIHLSQRVDGGEIDSTSSAARVISLANGSTKTIDFTNFHPNIISVQSLNDFDRNFSTTNDRLPTSWNLKLYRDSVSALTLLSEIASDTMLTVENLGDGSYVVAESDSVRWNHLGIVSSDTAFSSATKDWKIVVADGQTKNVQFINALIADTIFLQHYHDVDSTFATTNDRVAKRWGMLLLDESNQIIAEADTEQLVFSELLPGNYVAKVVDSLRWKHFGYTHILNGMTMFNDESSVRKIPITISGGGNVLVIKFLSSNADSVLSLNTASKTGFWKSNATWSKKSVPATGDSVVIPTAKKITADAFDSVKTTVTVSSLNVIGTLLVSNSDSLVILRDMKISGTVTVDSEATPTFVVFGSLIITGKFYAGQSTFVLVGANPETLQANGKTFYNLSFGSDIANAKTSFHFSDNSEKLIPAVTSNPNIVLNSYVYVNGYLSLLNNVNANNYTIYVYNNEAISVDGTGEIFSGRLYRNFGEESNAYRFAHPRIFITPDGTSFGGGSVSEFTHATPATFSDFLVSYETTVDKDLNTVTAANLPYGYYAIGHQRAKTQNAPLLSSVYSLNAYYNGEYEVTLKYEQSQIIGNINEDSLVIMKLEVPPCYSDTIKFRTIKNTTALGSKAVKFKMKNGVLISSPPNWATVTEAVFKKIPMKYGMNLGSQIKEKDIAADYAWIVLKKGMEFGKIFTAEHTAQSRPLDSLRLPKKTKKLSKQVKVTRKQFNNPAIAEGLVYKLNLAASAYGITPQGFGGLLLDTAYSFFDYDLYGKNLSQIGGYFDTVMTFWSDFGIEDSATYAQLDDFVNNILKRLNGLFSAELHETNYVINTYNVKKNPYDMYLKGTKTSPEVGLVKCAPQVIEERSFLTELEENIPLRFSLEQNYPNPFNPLTTIHYTLSTPALVSLKIYNVLGQEVATLIHSREMDEGMHEIQFDASKLSSGVYFYRLYVGQNGILSYTATKKLVLMK